LAVARDAVVTGLAAGCSNAQFAAVTNSVIVQSGCGTPMRVYLLFLQ
jgi:hypothetical protein